LRKSAVLKPHAKVKGYGLNDNDDDGLIESNVAFKMMKNLSAQCGEIQS
jgi:hypothetical protein